jgi:hypothetical protein
MAFKEVEEKSAMQIAEEIRQQVQRLPTNLQVVVLDFIEYLLAKTERQEERDRSDLSLISATRGVEEKEAPPNAPADEQEGIVAQQMENSLLYCILGNTVILILFILIGFVLKSNMVLVQLLPCILPEAKVPSLAVTLLLLIHLFIGSGSTKSVFDTDKRLKFLILIVERFHPRKLSKRILFAMVILLCFWLGILWLYPPSLLLAPEPVPAIDRIEVIFDDKTTKPYKDGEQIEIKVDSSITVKAVILNRDNESCTWSTNSGSLDPIDECSTKYTSISSISPGERLLELNVTSSCGNRKASAAWHIKVAP